MEHKYIKKNILVLATKTYSLHPLDMVRTNNQRITYV